MPSGKIANNMRDYLKLKSELQDTLQKDATTSSINATANNAGPTSSTSSMLNTEVTNRLIDWHKGPQAVYFSERDANTKIAQQCRFSSIAILEAKPVIKPVLLYDDSSDINEHCSIKKSQYRFGNLEVYNVVNSFSGVWQQIPDGYVTDMSNILTHLKVRVVGSKESFVNKLFKCL